MARALPYLAVLSLTLAGLFADSVVGRQYRNSEGNTVSSGVVIESDDIAVSGGNPLPGISMPFERFGKAFSLPVSTAPQTYAIDQPIGSVSYRGINPCSVDVVISSVSVSTPVTTQPVTIGGQTVPNVLRVTSTTDTVNQFMDTLFLARSGRVLTSIKNPANGQTRYISIMALADPGATPCAFRMHYGRAN